MITKVIEVRTTKRKSPGIQGAMTPPLEVSKKEIGVIITDGDMILAERRALKEFPAANWVEHFADGDCTPFCSGAIR